MKLPAPFFEKMSAQLGQGFESFLEALESPAPISIRLNPAKAIHEFENFERVKWHPLAFYLTERPVFTLDPLFHAGAYYVQEASSMFLYEALKQTVDLSKKLKVLDLCAAPGGKSTLLASAITKDSLLVANEAIKGRLPQLIMNLEKWGSPNVVLSNHDPSDFKGLNGYFDVVVVDAPCSGEGLFRKDWQAMKEWSETNVQLCEARQKRILEDSIGLLKVGGMLFYSTCTFNEFENSQQVKWLLSSGEFELVTLDIPEEWGIVDTGFGLQFYPHLLNGEGFFIACLRKISERKVERIKAPPVKWQALPLVKTKVLAGLFYDINEIRLFQKPRGEVIAVPIQLEEDFQFLSGQLKKRGLGLAAGMLKGDDFVPSHALALSNLVSKKLSAVALDKNLALQFLRKDNFHQENWPKGWALAQYRGLNLGWMKVLDSRTNNYVPNEWRIRMLLP